MVSTPPKPSLVKSTALVQAQATTTRFNAFLPSITSAESPVTVYEAGTSGIGGELSAPTSVFPAGSGYYGVWTAPDLNNGQPYTIQVECFGGGGGGGGGSTTTGGGGGGGGEYSAEQYYPVVPGQDYVWTVGVPGSAGSANSDSNVLAVAGGPGGTTVFDIAGLGVAGGVVANGGTGGDVGNTGLGGSGGAGSANTVEFGGGAGGTNLPGGGGGSGGQGGTDNPVTLFNAGFIGASPLAWYILNDVSSSGTLNDSSGNNARPTPGSYSPPGLTYANGGVPSQVPAYAGPASPPGMPNATAASACVYFPRSNAYLLTPAIDWEGSHTTISCWLAADASGAYSSNTYNGARGVIAANTMGYSRGNNASGGALYVQNTGSSSNQSWQLVWYCANGSSSQTVTTSLPPGPAYYIVATFSSGTMTLWVNGVSAGTASAGFSKVSQGAQYSMTIGMNPTVSGDALFGYLANIWFADGTLNSSGVTQAFSGSGGSSTAGGAGGGASGGPDAGGGAGSAGSGSTGGAGGIPAVQPPAQVGINTPGQAGIAGAAGGSGNSGITGGSGAGGGGAGSGASPPNIITVTVPFTTASAYSGTDAVGGAAGLPYSPVIQGTNGRLFTGGLATDAPSGTKNSLLVLQPGLAATLAGNTVLRVTLTVTNANPQATQNALMEVGWSADTFLPGTYTGSDITGSAGVVEIPVGAYTVTQELTESQLGLYLANGGATALVLGPGASPTFESYAASTAPDFYTAIYGPGAVDAAGNSLAPFLTVTYAQGGSGTVQQGSPGGAGAILVTFVNQAENLVGHWTAVDGLNAAGGQLEETTVVLGSAGGDDLRGLLAPRAKRGLSPFRAGARLGAAPGVAGGAVLGYTAGTTNVTQSTPGSYTFTVPAGVTSLSVSCWGAGAGATGGSSGQGQAGGGAGAFAAEPSYTVIPGQVLAYTVGAGGTGDHVGSNSGPDGGATGFDTGNVAGSGVTAQGGQHYNGSLNYGPGGGTNGNSVNFGGGNGGPLNSGQSNGSGGGGSAGSTSRGFGGSQGGGAGAAGGGGGAVGGVGSGSGTNGHNGAAPGGGGGGAGKGSSSLTGGNGANGSITFSYVSSSALSVSLATASGTDINGNAFPAGIQAPASSVSGTSSMQTLAVTANATVGGTHGVNGLLSANAGISATGDVNGSGNGNFTSGQLNAATVAASGAASSGGNFTSHGTVHGDTGVSSGGNVSASGNITASNFTGSYAGSQGTPGAYPAVGSPSNAGLATYSNQIVAILIAAGVC